RVRHGRSRPSGADRSIVSGQPPEPAERTPGPDGRGWPGRPTTFGTNTPIGLRPRPSSVGYARPGIWGGTVARRIRIVVGEGRTAQRGLLRFVLEGEGFDVVGEARGSADLSSAIEAQRPD